MGYVLNSLAPSGRFAPHGHSTGQLQDSRGESRQGNHKDRSRSQRTDCQGAAGAPGKATASKAVFRALTSAERRLRTRSLPRRPASRSALPLTPLQRTGPGIAHSAPGGGRVQPERGGARRGAGPGGSRRDFLLCPRPAAAATATATAARGPSPTARGLQRPPPMDFT